MAKRFKFRLETVLKIRQQREDAAKRVVADRLRDIGSVKSEITTLQGQIRSGIAEFRQSHSAGRIDIMQITRHRQWLVHLDHGVLTVQSHLAELEGQLGHEREALAEARKRVRVLEKLKERQHERYRTELKRVEVRENDEIGNALYLRRQAAEVG